MRADLAPASVDPAFDALLDILAAHLVEEFLAEIEAGTDCADEATHEHEEITR